MGLMLQYDGKRLMHSRAILIGIAFGAVATTLAGIVDLEEVLWPGLSRQSLLLIGIVVTSATWLVAEQDIRRVKRTRSDEPRDPKQGSSPR